MLVRRVTGVTRLSRTLAQQWIESGAVIVDGRPAPRPSVRVREGAAVEVALPSTTVLKSRPEPEAGAIDVLYEDAALIAVNKPAGVVVHPSYKQPSGTLLNAILWHVRDKGTPSRRSGPQGADARPGILTRLDKDTSGIVIVALTPQVHAAMQRDAAAGRIRKEYLAIVCGVPRPRTGRIREPLARDPDDRRRVVVMEGGADSETIYEVMEGRRGGPSGPPSLSLVRCELVTGRTHQIRVHLSHRGWPILGDRVYGTADESMPRQALHAWRVRFPHPTTGQSINIEAPLPDDMARIAGGR